MKHITSGFEHAFAFLAALFILGLYQTVMVWGNINLFFERIMGLTSASFISSILLFWAIASIFWIIALKVLDLAHKTKLYKTKNVLFGMVFLFFAVPFGVCIQIYHSLAINTAVTTVTTAIFIMTIVSFIMGFVVKFRKPVQ
ncbi:hypothetical protein AWM68_13195 [Fictibacillus phosphorivorans]|uniref:Uncharacterized protein n=1 Tax=Fictibacillus phosphorivorans TaxID=1221500 RepID=A0A165MZN4_9BACL|nr:hypothetical protein [Fictibacillus phosphorivorans]KZE64057.1 hypothetical protein AWM68_13195 [Fictibacillus phosphorivorans]